MIKVFVICESSPALLRDAVACFTTTNVSEVEWPVDIGRFMGEIHPLTKWQKAMSAGILC